MKEIGTGILTAIKGLLVLAAFIAVLKFIFVPTQSNLVPDVDSDGEVRGFVYRVDSWWGLKHEEFAAWMTTRGPVYSIDDKTEPKVVPEEAFEQGPW